jgi:hypothetical protein
MSTEIPQPVQLLLNEYIGLVNAALPGLLSGFYLHGSLALGAFNFGQSDIDFVAITTRRCTTSDIDALRAIHRTLTERYPRIPLEGSYLEQRNLGQLEDTMPALPYIHDGIFHPSGHHDINGVTWWVLKHHGIAVIGPPPDHLDIPVDWDALIVKMRHNLNTYWASFITNPRHLAWLLNDDGIQWAVLGVLRQFYTFREHAITSKIDAGRYGLLHTPEKWHQLIQEAIHIRENRRASSYRLRIVRAITTRAFLQSIIATCNSAELKR